MTKTKLVEKAAKKCGLSVKDTGKVLDACLEAIKDSLAKGESVQLIGFGTFEVSERAERVGRNPQTGETMTIAATKVPKFKAGKALKDAVK